MEVTQSSVNGTNARNHAEEELKSEPEPAPTPSLNTVDFHVWFSDLPSSEGNVKLNPVLDTPSLDLGLLAPNPAQVVSKNEQGNATHLDGLVLSTAPTSDPPTKPENAKPNPAPSTETGERGHHGPNVRNPVVKDPRQRAENATAHHHNMEDSNVQDTTPLKLYVRSNLVQFMEVGHSGLNMVLAVRPVVAENKYEHVSAPTPHPNTVVRHVQV